VEQPLQSNAIMKKTNLTPFVIVAFVSLTSAFGSYSVARASDNAETRVQDAGTDANTSAKKTVRKVKRGVRKATGQDTGMKDMGDHVNDSVDDAKGALEKAKH
jgi:hypothetical protein